MELSRARDYLRSHRLIGMNEFFFQRSREYNLITHPVLNTQKRF